MTKRKGATKLETEPCPNCGRGVEMVYEGRGYVGRCPCTPGRAVLFRSDHRPLLDSDDRGGAGPSSESPLKIGEGTEADEVS